MVNEPKGEELYESLLNFKCFEWTICSVLARDRRVITSSINIALIILNGNGKALAVEYAPKLLHGSNDKVLFMREKMVQL